MYKRNVSVAAAALCLFACLVSCSKPAPAAARVPGVPVDLAPIRYAAEAVPVRVAGIVSRTSEAELSFKTGGIIQEVRVRAGDTVRKGEVLAHLRPEELEAQVIQARSALEKAKRDLERVTRLRAGNVATIENAQDAATAVDVAAATLQVAQFNREQSDILAPADGRILRRSAEPNELVGPGRPVLSFGSDVDGWLVRAGLSERDLARVKVGDEAIVEDLEVGGAPVKGAVSHISEAADPATRTTEVEIALEQAVPGTRSGYVVAVRIQPGPVTERPVVPATALIEGSERRAFVYVVDNGAGKARRLQVEIEEVEGGSVYLRTPLPREARIVTAGAEYLRDGAEVETQVAKAGS